MQESGRIEESNQLIQQIQQIIHRNAPRIYQKLLQEYELLKKVKREIEIKRYLFENHKNINEARLGIGTFMALVREIKDESIKNKLLELIETLFHRLLESKLNECIKTIDKIISIIDEQLGKIEKIKI